MGKDKEQSFNYISKKYLYRRVAMKCDGDDIYRTGRVAAVIKEPTGKVLLLVRCDEGKIYKGGYRDAHLL